MRSSTPIFIAPEWDGGDIWLYDCGWRLAGQHPYRCDWFGISQPVGIKDFFDETGAIPGRPVEVRPVPEWAVEHMAQRRKDNVVQLYSSQCVSKDDHYPLSFWSWVYFHGKAEDWMAKTSTKEAPDLVKCAVRIDNVADGEWDALLYRPKDGDSTEPCSYGGAVEGKLFLWSLRGKQSGHAAGVDRPWYQRRAGLVCLRDDLESCEYARRKLEEKSKWL